MLAVDSRLWDILDSVANVGAQTDIQVKDQSWKTRKFKKQNDCKSCSQFYWCLMFQNWTNILEVTNAINLYVFRNNGKYFSKISENFFY